MKTFRHFWRYLANESHCVDGSSQDSECVLTLLNVTVSVAHFLFPRHIWPVWNYPPGICMEKLRTTTAIVAWDIIYTFEARNSWMKSGNAGSFAVLEACNVDGENFYFDLITPITPWIRVLFEKLTVPQSRISQRFIHLVGSLPCLKISDSCHYPVPD